MDRASTTIEMTKSQRLAIIGSDSSVRLLDPETHQEYVVLRAELYQRLRHLLYEDRDASPQIAYPLVDEVFREDRDDPKMAEYDYYEDHKR